MEDPSSTLTVLLTREIRWFRSGPLPEPTVDWFTGGGALGEIEQRVDCYDPVPAQNGIGVKLRNTQGLDTKFRLAREPDVSVAPGLRGAVEDWLKVSQPQSDAHREQRGAFVAVDKSLMTRTYHFEPADNGHHLVPTGCDIELAALAIDGLSAWSVCVEAFGAPSQLEHAFRTGISWWLNETPLPESLEFRTEDSSSYPAWLARHRVRHGD